MNKYLETSQLSIEEIKQGLRQRTLRNEIVPVLCGSAFKNKGVQAMLDAVIEFLPSPMDVAAVKGEDERGNPDTRPVDDSAPFSALAFKIMTDPFVGTLTFIRVYSGTAKSGDSVYNPVKSKKERIGRILQMHANTREEIKRVEEFLESPKRISNSYTSKEDARDHLSYQKLKESSIQKKIEESKNGMRRPL